MPSKPNQESTQHTGEVVATATHLEPASNSTAQPIWEQIVEIGTQVPPQEWQQVPSDLSKNLKHYLYAEPKGQE